MMRFNVLLLLALFSIGCLSPRTEMMSSIDPKDFFTEPELSVAAAISSGHSTVIPGLLDQDRTLNVNAIGQRGITLLYWAVMHTDQLAVQYLLQAGADPNIWTEENEQRSHALALSVRAKDDAIFNALMEAGADPNASMDGTFATFHAMMAEKNHRMKRMVENGAEIDAVDPVYRVSLVHFCAMVENYESVVYLLQHGAKHDVVGSANMTLAYEVVEAEDTLDDEQEKWRLKTVELLKQRGVSFPDDQPAQHE